MKRLIVTAIAALSLLISAPVAYASPEDGPGGGQQNCVGFPDGSWWCYVNGQWVRWW